VRETSIDAILVTGGADALPLVAPLLEKEADVNVIHGALRKLKDVPGEASAKLAASFLNHADEDLLVSAIQTCLKLASGDQTSSRYSASENKSSANNGEAAIIAALADPRWRVRVAALEYIAGRKVTQAADTVLKLLDDPDEFVRFASIKTAAALELKTAVPKLKATFMANEAMVGPVLEAYAALSQKPDAEMLAHLSKANPEARIAAIRAAETNKFLVDTVARFAMDPDIDVACAALRFISADADRVATAETASLLVQALRSGQPEKRTAILDRLTLPVSKEVDLAVMRLLGTALERPEKTVLDPLYHGFLHPLNSENPKEPEKTVQKIPAAQAALITELTLLAQDAAAPDLQFSATLALARSGNPDAYKVLFQLLPTLCTARKAAIAEGIREPSHRDAMPLLQALMRDPLEEIRSAAAASSLSNEKSPAFVQLVLNELTRPETLLQPHEIYSYNFESVAREKAISPLLGAWAVNVLNSPTAKNPLKIIACIALRNQASVSASASLATLVKSSPNPWLRRAAAHALGCTRPNEWKPLGEKISTDPSPHVRVVIPAVVNRKYHTWTHHFDDVHALVDHSYYYDHSSRSATKLDPVILAALERLAEPTEISPSVRFSALFALITQGAPVDINVTLQLLGQQPEDARVPYHLAQWFESAAGKVGPGLLPLFSAIDTSDIDSDKMKTLIKRLKPQGKGEISPTNFAALGSQIVDSTATQQVSVAEKAPARILRNSLPVIFFYKPGCKECNRTRELLDALKQDHPTMTVDEYNILEANAVVLNQALCARFQVPSLKHNIAPTLFTQSGFLIRENIEPPALAALLGKTAATDQDNAWKTIEQPQIQAAKEQVTQRYQALTLPIIIGAGLLDGVNPCAFATIIFFLSYLQIARRSRREMLLTGVAFILGVFIAYLAAGLFLYHVLASLHQRFVGIQNWLNPIFAGLALIAAALSFRDALRARRGHLDEMTLQLPGFLKDRIRGVIRTGVRARRFVIAAFFTGIAISFLELACTGQVYAPIIYQIQQGKIDAIAMLVIYNLAFITPLIIIFGLAYGGLRSETLIALQKRHTVAVKLALGTLFIILAAFIIFGNRLLSST
jgi:cytochrome c biogenesis protein CcdA/HEAT repeat protein